MFSILFPGSCKLDGLACNRPHGKRRPTSARRRPALSAQCLSAVLSHQSDLAMFTASCPVIASTTSRTSVGVYGADKRLGSAASISSSICRRPAVSTIKRIIHAGLPPTFSACFTIFTGSVTTAVYRDHPSARPGFLADLPQPAAQCHMLPAWDFSPAFSNTAPSLAGKCRFTGTLQAA